MKGFFSYLENEYPLSRPQDVVKALQQCHFGAGHAVELLSAYEKTASESLLCKGNGRIETMPNGFCRYHLGEEDAARIKAISALFCEGAKVTVEGFDRALQEFSEYPFKCFSQGEKEEFLSVFELANRPILSHSEEYRRAYRPHYRVMPFSYAKLIGVLADLYRLEKMPVVMAIDGRCAAGKTTTAEILGKVIGAEIIHCDDFFIPLAKRNEPHEINLDAERFVGEVAKPLSEGRTPVYRKYDCHTDAFSSCGAHPPAPYYIIEGSYSTAPCLGRYYDYSVFCDVTPEEQKNRLLLREGEEGWKSFRDRWIPLEEEYFARYDVRARCDSVLE